MNCKEFESAVIELPSLNLPGWTEEMYVLAWGERARFAYCIA